MIFAFAAPLAVSAQPTQSIEYQIDERPIANPERGWQKTYNPDYQTNVQAPGYDLNELVALRETEGVTLVDKYYLLFAFKRSAISEAYLDDFQADMDVVRRAGLKTVVRFAYNFNQSNLSDTDRDRVLQHITQLKPYLQRNADVIAFMEAGFIGKWAEWHGSTNGLLGGEYRVDVNDNTRAVYDALLDALPARRMIAIRYVYQMQDLLERTDCQKDASARDPFPAERAFDGSKLARTGRHDDWFLGDAGDNSGTWSYDEDARDCQRAFLAAQSKYVPITTGETQTFNAFNRGNSPIPELEAFHFASLSSNPGGPGEELIDHWRGNGTYDELARRFGYRFVLRRATVPTVTSSGEPISLEIEVENVGFGTPYNPRTFEIVLRDLATGEVTQYDLTATRGNELDPRHWFREDGVVTKSVTFDPGALKPGDYEVLLNLPDPDPALYGRPAYSIRLANAGLWEEATGFNALNTSIRVVESDDPPTADGPPNGVYELHPASSPERVVEVASVSGDGDDVRLGVDADAPVQRWRVTRLGEGLAHLSPLHDPRLRLDVYSWSGGAGTDAVVWNQAEGDDVNQRWRFLRVGDDYEVIPWYAPVGGLDLRLAAVGSDGTADLALAVRDGSPSQRFRFEPVDESTLDERSGDERDSSEAPATISPNPSPGESFDVRYADAPVSEVPTVIVYDIRGQRLGVQVHALDDGFSVVPTAGQRFAAGVYVIAVVRSGRVTRRYRAIVQ